VISFLRSNLVWILLSVLISLGLWVIVTFQQDPEVTDVLANVAVDVQNVPKTVLVQPDTTSVQLTVTAPKDVWPQLKADRFHAVVDAGKVSPGVQQLPVNVVSIDSRARIESWSPDTIALRVDPLRTKTVPDSSTRPCSEGFAAALPCSRPARTAGLGTRIDAGVGAAGAGTGAGSGAVSAAGSAVAGVGASSTAVISSEMSTAGSFSGVWSVTVRPSSRRHSP
jgi:hypothetical protein